MSKTDKILVSAVCYAFACCILVFAAAMIAAWMGDINKLPVWTAYIVVIQLGVVGLATLGRIAYTTWKE